MIKTPIASLSAILVAATLVVSSGAFAQKKDCPTNDPMCDPLFGPKDLPEPVGPALVPAQTAPVPMPPAVAASSSLSLTDAQVKAWVDKAVYSSDDKKVGEVAAFARDGTGKVTELHADIGGFLGMGETRIRLMPTQFKMGADRIILLMTAEQAKTQPTVKK